MIPNANIQARSVRRSRNSGAAKKTMLQEAPIATHRDALYVALLGHEPCPSRGPRNLLLASDVVIGTTLKFPPELKTNDQLRRRLRGLLRA
jgi:hypothetical protein